LVSVYKNGDELYLKEIMYVKGMTVPDIIYEMEKMKISRVENIWADSALPQNIEEVKRNRFNIKPVSKKTILHGLDLIRRHHVYITKDSKNIINEFSSYRYREDKDGNLLDVPEDDNNHAIDAVRYVLESELNKRTGKITIV
jgi:phage terminase large subunit